MIIETELKLTIAQADIPKFLAHDALKTYAVQPMTKYHLKSIYFDTYDGYLLHNGFVLRIRKKEELYLQTIKSVNKSHAGLHRHYEWQHNVADWKPDLSKIPEKKLQTALLDKNAKQVEPIFVTDIERMCWNLAKNGTQIELALDVGKVVAGNASEDITEIELELITGEEKKLFEMAELFSNDICLISENRSKAERGYKLASISFQP